MLESVLDFFFPKRCLGCGRAGTYICEVCEQKIPFLEDQYCAVCQKPSVGGFTHHRCRGTHKPERILSLLSYRDLGRKLVTVLKYEKVTDLRHLIGREAVNFLNDSNISLGRETVVTFVPTHPLKFLERGFNQAELIAKEVSKAKSLKILPVLDKVLESPSQTALSRTERKQNIEGSFALNPEFQNEVYDHDILLVDDVFTTGATLLECSRVLKKSGARFIYLLTLAKD